MYTKKIDTPKPIAQCDGGYIEIKTRIKRKHQRILQEAISGYARIAQATTNVEDLRNDEQAQNEVLNVIASVGDIEANLPGVFAHLVVGWNWLDSDTGQPLANPQEQPGVLDELDMLQYQFMQQQIYKILQNPVTEGNPPNGAASNAGVKAEATPHPNG